jgi:hypothetical protein
MKRFIASFAALAVGVTLLSAPTVALSTPGKSCNPSAGHGNSGCHRVTTSPTPQPSAQAQTNAAAQATAAAQAKAAAKASAAAKAEAAAAARAKAEAEALAAAQAKADAEAAAQAEAEAAARDEAEAAALRIEVVEQVKARVAAEKAAAEARPWWVKLWARIAG